MGMGQKASAASKEQEIADPVLRLKLNPFYTLGCKRMLISDDFYATMTRPNVELVTDAIREVRPGGIVAGDGRERPCDVIVFATGFDAFNATAEMTIRGREGRTLATDWAAGPEGYLGVAVSGYPNLFLIMGPNSGLGHNSVPVVIEAQARYIARCLDWLDHGRLPDARHQRSRQVAGLGETPHRPQKNTTPGGKPGVPGAVCSGPGDGARGSRTAQQFENACERASGSAIDRALLSPARRGP